MKKFQIIILFLLLASTTFAQDYLSKDLLPLGSKRPNLSLPIQFGGKSAQKVTPLSHYEGQWLLIEFWGKFCTVCIAGFPKMEALRKQYAGRVNVLLIGSNDRRSRGIEDFYARFQQELGLGFDIAYDSLALKAFGVRSVPTLYLIDPKGKVAYHSLSNRLDTTVLNQVLAGQIPTSGPNFTDISKLVNVDSLSRPEHHSSLEVIGNDRSWATRLEIAKAFKNGKFRSGPISLGRLYQLAHFGKASWLPIDSGSSQIYRQPLLLVRDSTLFLAPNGQTKHQYGYQLTFRDSSATVADAQQALARDLAQWFTYRSQVEVRPMPVWLLQVNDLAKVQSLRSSSSKASRSGDASHFQLKGFSGKGLREFLQNYLAHEVILDGTDFDYRIDLSLKAAMTDLSSVNRTLANHGLQLVRRQVPLQVLVISDP